MPRPCQRVRLESGLKLDLNRLAPTLLQQNLDEEKAADKKLTAMAESKVNRKAA